MSGDSVAKGVLREREAIELVRDVTRDLVGVSLRPAIDEAVRPAADAAAGSGAPPSRSPTATAAVASPARRPVAGSPVAGGPVAGAPRVAGSPVAGSRVAPGAGLDDVRSNPTVKAVLDAFGARVLAVQTTDADPSAEAAGGAA